MTIPEQQNTLIEQNCDMQEKLAVFFANIEHLSKQAIAGNGETALNCMIAGQVVRFRGAGSAMLESLTPAFAHLEIQNGTGTSDLTILLWDSTSTGIKMAAPLWGNNDYTLRGDIRGFDDPRYRISFHTPSGMFSFLDMERGLAICWTNDARDIPSYVHGMPLLPIFHWWMAARSIQLMHGGVVGNRDGAFLLAGKGKAGKSSTALNSLSHPGMLYLSDDYCLVELGERPRAHSLYSTGRLHPWDLEALPFVRPALSNPQDLDKDKALLFLHPHFESRLVPELPLRAILMPRIGDYSRIKVEKAHPAVAHRALTAVTLHHLPGAGEATIHNISRLVRSLPCYYLNLGKDRQEIPQAITDFLSSQQ